MPVSAPTVLGITSFLTERRLSVSSHQLCHTLVLLFALCFLSLSLSPSPVCDFLCGSFSSNDTGLLAHVSRSESEREKARDESRMRRSSITRARRDSAARAALASGACSWTHSHAHPQQRPQQGPRQRPQHVRSRWWRRWRLRDAEYAWNMSDAPVVLFMR